MDQKVTSNRESSAGSADEGIDSKWEESLFEVMREVIFQLPEETSLGEIVNAARTNPYFSRVLRQISVKDLITLACERPSPAALKAKSTGKSSAETDEDDDFADSAASLDLGTAAVIRRRADVPNGDVLVLRYLAEHGPQGETSIGRGTHLTSDQVRLLLRNLNTRGLIHAEGSGAKKKIRLTRAGQGALRQSEPTTQRSL